MSCWKELSLLLGVLAPLMLEGGFESSLLFAFCCWSLLTLPTPPLPSMFTGGVDERLLSQLGVAESPFTATEPGVLGCSLFTLPTGC